MDEYFFYYHSIKYKLLQQLRGELSQNQLSEKLGYKFNQYHKWEIGSKSLSLFDFIDICDVLGLDFFKAIEKVFIINLKDQNEAQIFEKLYLLLGPEDKDQLAELLDINKSTLYRWLKGKGSPDLSIILFWIDKRTQYLKSFMSELIGKYDADRILKEDSKRVDQYKIYKDYPYLPALEYYFYTTQYDKARHIGISAIANDLNLSVEQVEIGIQTLLNNNAITIDDDKKYTINHKRKDLGTMHISTSAAVGKYWTQKSLDRFNTPDHIPIKTGEASNMWAWRIIPVPKSLEMPIKERFSLCFKDITEMIEEHEGPADSIKAFVFHMFDAGDS
jgi:transcriptional regulator with XRE-family HTH domain